MVRSVPIIRAFNSGELSPLLLGRTDEDKYHNGCLAQYNFLPLSQGPATRRGGTRYVGAVKASANRTWLAPFKFSLLQNYMLEFGDHYIRFWTNRGQLLNGGTPYEVATPYAVADLTTAGGTFALRFDQSGDVLYIAHCNGLYAPQILSRFGATNWTLTQIAFTDGPFQPIDLQQSVSLSVSALTGSVTVTASVARFSPTDVGTSIYLEAPNPGAPPSWRSGVGYTVGQIVTNAGNFYAATTGGTSGTNAPTQTQGTATDNGAVTWKYLHSGYGVVQITGYTDPTHVTGTVFTAWQTEAQPTQLPSDLSTAGGGYAGSTSTTRWALSLFGAARGWPVDVKFFRSRLCYIGSNWLAASQSGVYNSFALKDGPDALETCAILLQLPVEALSWVAPSLALLMGTPSSERSLQEQSTAKAFAADNLKEQAETKYGAAQIEPLVFAQSVLFVQRTQTRIRELTFDYLKQRYSGDDIVVLSEHLFTSGIIDWAWAQEPDGLIWCVVGDGSLRACTYNRERGVLAWSRHYLGGNGFVEACAVIPSPDGKKDDLWLVVRRTINGQTVRYVEFMEDRKLYQTGLQNAVFMDCAISYSGASTNTIAGLSHLEGQTVDLLIDGSPSSQANVSGGQIVMSRAGSTVQIGVHQPAIIAPMPIDTEGPDGTGQTRNKAYAQVYARFVDTVGGKSGANYPVGDPIARIDFSGVIGAPPTLFTGDVQMNQDHGFPGDADIYIWQDQPLPMTLIALVPRIEIND